MSKTDLPLKAVNVPKIYKWRWCTCGFSFSFLCPIDSEHCNPYGYSYFISTSVEQLSGIYHHLRGTSTKRFYTYWVLFPFTFPCIFGNERHFLLFLITWPRFSSSWCSVAISSSFFTHKGINSIYIQLCWMYDVLNIILFLLPLHFEMCLQRGLTVSLKKQS